jgi:hypothetical protein
MVGSPATDRDPCQASRDPRPSGFKDSNTTYFSGSGTVRKRPKQALRGYTMCGIQRGVLRISATTLRVATWFGSGADKLFAALSVVTVSTSAFYERLGSGLPSRDG